MTDPKSRKVIVLENPLLPTRIKEMIARCLFEDLLVRAISGSVYSEGRRLIKAWMEVRSRRCRFCRVTSLRFSLWGERLAWSLTSGSSRPWFFP